MRLRDGAEAEADMSARVRVRKPEIFSGRTMTAMALLTPRVRVRVRVVVCGCQLDLITVRGCVSSTCFISCQNCLSQVKYWGGRRFLAISITVQYGHTVL